MAREARERQNVVAIAPAVEPEDADFAISDEGADCGPDVDDFGKLSDYALPQDFDPHVEEEDPPVPVRRPGPVDFFRVNPDPAMACTVGIVELQGERDDPYLVKPNMFPLFGNLISRRLLVVCRNTQGIVHLWPLKLDKGGRRNQYNATALKAAERAKTKWTRLWNDDDLKAYRFGGPTDEYPEPTWPNATLLDLIKRGFGDGYLVKDGNHPLARRIRGQIG